MALEKLRRTFTPEDEQEDLANLGVVPVPSPDEKVDSQESDLLMPFYRPVSEEEMPPESLRRSFDEEQRLAPFFRRDTVTVPESLRRPVEVAPRPATGAATITSPSLPAAPVVKTPEAAPIPVKTAPPNRDVAAPTVSVREPVTSTSPAGPPDSSGKDGMVSPPSEGAGGDADEERNLYLARLIARNAASFGAMGAGKSIDTGAVEALGERLKQVQALRAKREERGLELTQERAQNDQLLDAYKGMFPEKATELESLRGATGKPMFRDLLNAWQKKVEFEKAKLPTAEARIEQMGAGTALTKAKTPEVALEGESKRKLRAAQVAKVYKDMELAGAKLALDERKTLEQAQQAKDPFKKLESLNTIADKKEFGGFTTLAGDLADLESVAPGFVTRGEVPDWLTREQQLLGQNWPTSTDPRVVDFLAAYGKVANEERHRQYGSAQTDGELRAFMQQLNSSPLSAGPQVLAQQVKRFGQAAGRVAKGRLTRYNNVFGAENVDTVLGPEWKKLFNEGGVFAAQGSPFVAARPAAAGGVPAPAGGVAEAPPAVGAGKTALWSVAENKWKQIPNDKVDAAVSSGKYRRTR